MRALFFLILLAIRNVGLTQHYTVEQVTSNIESVSTICPTLIGDGFVYMSNEKSAYLKTVIDLSETYPYHLYYQKIDSIIPAGKKEIFAKELATVFNNGPISVHSDGRDIVFSKNTENASLRKNKKQVTMGIFFSSKVGDIWTDPIPFPYNSEEYSITHPTINNTGDLIIFSSAQNKTDNGMDLYYSIKTKDVWSAPVPLDERINTIGNEVYPSISGDKVYYSTNGKNDSTGLDIWSFIFENTIASNPVKLDTNINSNYDDFGITLRSNDLEGYFTSNRNGNDQIYYFEKHFPKLDNCPPQKKISYCYLIEEHNMLDESGMPLKFTWDFGDGTSQNGYRVKHCYDTLGSYTAVLNIFDTITGDIFYEVSEVNITISAPKTPRILYHDTLFKDEKNMFNSDLTHYKSDYKEILWQLDDSKIYTGKEIEAKLGNSDSSIVKMGVIELDGKVTCVSQKIFLKSRTEQAAFLSEKIIVKEIINTEEQDSTQNYSVKIHSSEEKISLDDSIFDNVDYPIKEDYFEFKKLYSYTVGNSEDIEDLYLLYREMKELGYDSEVIKTEIDKNILNSNSNVALTVFFAVSKSSLTAYNSQNISNLCETINDKSQIIIKGYADPTGNFENNQKLSHDRAISVKQELIKKGIQASQIVVSAKGQIESDITNEAQLQTLRKVEIEIKN